MGTSAGRARLPNMIQVVTSALPPLGMRLASAAARLDEGCTGYRSVAAQFGAPLSDLSGALEGYETAVSAALRGQAGNLAMLGLALVGAGSAYAEADNRAIVPGLGFCPAPGAPDGGLFGGTPGALDETARPRRRTAGLVMSALLAARLPGPATSASISADELNAVLARIRARCRPDLAVSAAQRLEALLGVAEASRAELRAARSGATGWLGLGSVAFVGSVDRAEAEAGRASEAVSSGAAALRSYADVAQTRLDRCWGLEHQLLVACDERSRGLAAEATAEPVPPAGRGADQLFDSVTGDLLRAARLLLEEVEAAIAALMARLSQLAVGSALPGDIALGSGPDAISLGCPRGGLSDWWGVGKEIKTGVGSAMTLWTGAKALSMFAAYARAPQGARAGVGRDALPRLVAAVSRRAWARFFARSRSLAISSR